MKAGPGDKAQWPLQGKHSQSKDEVDCLQNRDGFDSWVQVLGEEVPKYLGPNEPFNGSANLICTNVSDYCFPSRTGCKNIQAAAVRIMRRPKWFLISLPMVSNN